MARQLLHSLFALAVLSSVQAYFLVGNRDVLVTERLDPILSPGAVSSHTHSILGGSNFGMNITTALLRESECTTMPIQEDHSNYWFPTLYFQHKNGSFSDVSVGNVICMSLNLSLTISTMTRKDGQANTVQAFPDDFRMISGDMTLRSYNSSSYAQQAITFLCLDFNGVSTKYSSLPPVSCPSGVRAQINFPMCWDGVNVDSADHKSHVAFPSGGPDSGTCDDPAYPVTMPRIFIEAYLNTGPWDAIRETDALNSTQPYVYSFGDPYGFGYHADFYNGWQSGILQNVLDKCACTSAGFGDATCCGDLGVFTLDTSGSCNLTPIVDEQVTGTMAQLPGNNPVQYGPEDATIHAATTVPAILSPAYAYTGSSATATGNIVTSASSVAGGSATAASTTSVAPRPTLRPHPTRAHFSDSGSASVTAATTSNAAVASSTSSFVTATSDSDAASSTDEASATGTSSSVTITSDSDAVSSTDEASATGTSAWATTTSDSDASSSTDEASATVVSSTTDLDEASATVVSSVATAASSTAVSSSSGTGTNTSSSSPSSGDDDDEYEYYCEKRPKKKSRALVSKARRHHRRLASNDF
ncbi:hypothetical protein BT96DRAFT_992167 [Gymnopus androsaceus JB14]|uniref:DUF1996 domain-containing protein n=1 Tax=Gymnopus androsaceus JB14 TaxID=1447944 RepID=A0A6A4HT00_9AGAR|nr:hypothetical protein BT96DRAFT_992167 [Gymnopus androsaceus JB14]